MTFIDNFNRLKNNKIFGKMIMIIIVCILLIIASFIMLRYQVEGENDKNLPFILSKIIVVSSAEGEDNLEAIDAKWNLNLTQNNDIYISIAKNEDYKNSETIKNVSIENINIDKKKTIGTIKNYKPASEGLFENIEEYEILEDLKYVGSAETNIIRQEIGNHGGTILFRSSNLNVRNI